jgi:hypothetical protein
MTAVLIDEHVHEKVFNDRISELLALFVIKESALYFEGATIILTLSTTQEKIGVGQTHFIGQ